MPKPILLSITYFGPIQYYSKWASGYPLLLEAHENYPKQTFRNRCVIASANGRLNLTVPVVRETRVKVPIREVRIDYSEMWQKNHLRALESAYRKSPFYDYYIDDLLPCFAEKPTYLFDLNLALSSTLTALLKLDANPQLTTKYEAGNNDILDFRYSILPTKAKSDPLFRAPVYPQNFEEKWGFIENLSILDLLFQTGPDAGYWLRESWNPSGT